MASEPLPSEFMPFGHVVGRVIRAVGDTVADPDADPEAIPVTGKGLVRFTPLELTRVVAGTVPSTWVQQETIDADLDSEGFLALSGARGLLLWPGAWKVSAGSDSAFSFPAFTIKVTSAHTADAPLDLWTAAPYSPPSGVTVTTLVVPLGQQPGQSLVWDGSQLAWITPTITPSVSTLTAGSNATAAMSGSWPQSDLGARHPSGPAEHLSDCRRRPPRHPGIHDHGRAGSGRRRTGGGHLLLHRWRVRGGVAVAENYVWMDRYLRGHWLG